jgi:photosystem II stability/assembly factor-like uncharacterized protein
VIDRDDDLRGPLTDYLSGYSTYPRDTQPLPQQRASVTSVRRKRLLSSAIAVVVALIIGVPVGVTLLLRSGGTNSPAGIVKGPGDVADLHMISRTTGWAWGGGSQILHTNVGVQQWTIVPPPVGRFNVIEVAWIDAQSARILASSGSAQFVGTYRLVGWSTNDGGATWTEGQPFTALDETTQSLYSATALEFVDRTHGWFFDTQDGTEGSPIFIYRTVDAGAHWEQVEMTPARGAAAAGALPVGCLKYGMSFVDAKTGWVAGGCVGGGPFFDVTHDGGTTWIPQSLDCGDGCSLTAPQFTSPLDGELVAAVAVPTLFVTTDGGLTWKQRGNVPTTFVDFINANTGFALALTDNVNPSPVMWTTDDGGRSWHEARRAAGSGAAGPTSDVDEVDFVDASLGWVTPVGVTTFDPSNRIPTPTNTPFVFLQTDDGGATWRSVVPAFVQSAPQSGLIDGTLEAVGGAAPGTPRPLSGSITLRNSDGRVFTATAGSGGVFTVRVPIGTYTVTGRSPLYDSGSANCYSGGPATVTGAGETIHVIVACSEK